MAQVIMASFKVSLDVAALTEAELSNLIRDLRAHIGSTYWRDPIQEKANMLEYHTSLNMYKDQS